MTQVTAGLKATRVAMISNIVLAGVKVFTGVVGNSYALVADGIESLTDLASSVIVWMGLRISARPPDRTHPYGHGKAESLAAVMVALFLLGAALLIAVQAVREIRSPGGSPAWFTLPVLLIVILYKEGLYRYLLSVAHRLNSTSLLTDAWHHRLDAFTSMATFAGIGIALVGGPKYAAADDWAALLACGIIVFNGISLLQRGLDEIMDAAAPREIEIQVRTLADEVSGVANIEKCRIRKSGLGLLMDIHVTVDGQSTVHEGHQIGHRVKDHLMNSSLPIHDVIVHVEPDDL